MTDQFTLGYRAALEAAADVVENYDRQDGGCAEAILALPVPSLRETLDLDAGMDALCAEMGKNEPGVPNWREFNAAQQDTLRSVLRAGILAALGVKE